MKAFNHINIKLTCLIIEWWYWFINLVLNWISICMITKRNSYKRMWLNQHSMDCWFVFTTYYVVEENEMCFISIVHFKHDNKIMKWKSGARKKFWRVHKRIKNKKFNFLITKYTKRYQKLFSQGYLFHELIFLVI